jgi:2-phospho-L-lactate/phosphoenolpyruvate guanylyltransferase
MLDATYSPYSRPMPGTVIIPVKSFALGKQRLSGVLDPSLRARLGRALAGHVAATVAATGRNPHIVTSDPEVASWAGHSGYGLLDDPGGGLSAAARAAVSWATDRSKPWLVIHGDLPWLTAEDIGALMHPLDVGRPVIAPSADGGTSAIGSSGEFTFRFGPASFHHHLAALGDPVILTRPGLLLDVDSPADLRAATRSAPGTWLSGVLGPHG